MPRSTENFLFCHNLVTNRFPKGISLDELGTNPSLVPRVDVERFGLFDVSTPNFSTFYPQVTAEDLKPQDEDFIYPVFRALSEVIVNKFGPIDFSQSEVIRKSMRKLIGQSVYPNHDTNVGNELGAVVDVAWQEESKQNGVTIPAGFNARLKIDGKSNPKVARAVMMDPPSIHSTSVGVTFNWEKSHTEMEDEEFWNKLGTIEKKQLVRRVVTNIEAFHEISFVSHGADPYAQKITESGEINNPKYAKSRSNTFKAEDYQRMAHFMDWKEPNGFLTSSTFEEDTQRTIPEKSRDIAYRFDIENPNDKPMKKELLLFLISSFKLAADSTEEAVSTLLTSKLPEYLDAMDSSVSLQLELSSLKDKYPDGTQILSAEDQVKLQKYPELENQLTGILKATREEATKFYNLAVGGAEKADSVIVKLIQDSSSDALFALHTQYKKQADEQFVATCQDCNSTNVKRNSALGAIPSGSEGNAGDQKLTNDEVREKLTAAAQFTSVERIHGKAPIKK